MKLKIEIDRHDTTRDWVVRVIAYELFARKPTDQFIISGGSHQDRDVAASFALASIAREMSRARQMLVDFGASDSPEMLARLEVERVRKAKP